jgi:hypothetical protein
VNLPGWHEIQQLLDTVRGHSAESEGMANQLPEAISLDRGLGLKDGSNHREHRRLGAGVFPQCIQDIGSAFTLSTEGYEDLEVVIVATVLNLDHRRGPLLQI